MTNTNYAISKESLEAAAWVCYVHSLDGHTNHKITDEPKWSSEFHRDKYIRRANEIFEAVASRVAPIEGVREGFDEDGERLITAADVNNASAAKANELWGGNH